MLKERGNFRMMKKVLTLGITVFLGLACIGCNSSNKQTDNKADNNVSKQEISKMEEMKVTIFDCGDDSAAFIEINGENILIGSGTDEYSGKVVKYIKNEGIDTIDYAVLQDYGGQAKGFKEVFQNFSVKEMYVPQWNDDLIIEKPFRKSIVENIDAKSKLLELKTGDELKIGDAKLDVIFDKGSTKEAYDKSLVLRLQYGETSILFGGENVFRSELAKVEGIKSNVFIVPSAWLIKNLEIELAKSVDPDIAIIPLSRERKGSNDVEEVLKGRGSEVYTTCDIGDITLISDGEKIERK